MWQQHFRCSLFFLTIWCVVIELRTTHGMLWPVVPDRNGHHHPCLVTTSQSSPSVNCSVRKGRVHPEAQVGAATPSIHPRHHRRPPDLALQFPRYRAATEDPPPLTKARRLTCFGGARRCTAVVHRCGGGRDRGRGVCLGELAAHVQQLPASWLASRKDLCAEVN